MKLVSLKVGARVALCLFALCGACFGIVRGTGTAYAASGPQYTVADTAAGGVYSRRTPHVNDTPRTPGVGIYPRDVLTLECGVTDGDPVGPFQNHTWYFVHDNSRSEGDFWVNDHYMNTPNVANQMAPGVIRCPNESSNPMQPATHLPCTPLLVVGARGSGDPYQNDGNGLWGFSAPLTQLANGLLSYYGKDNVTTYGVPYPADPVWHHLSNLVFYDDGYGLSVKYGVEALIAIVTSQAQACPFQLIDLVGYSQGADVVNNAIPQLPQAAYDHINGVVTFGDPQFNGQHVEDWGTFDPTINGIEGARPELPGSILNRVRSYCVDTDVVCNPSPDSLFGKGHFEYGTSSVADAEQFLESLGYINSPGF